MEASATFLFLIGATFGASLVTVGCCLWFVRQLSQTVASLQQKIDRLDEIMAEHMEADPLYERVDGGETLP